MNTKKEIKIGSVIIGGSHPIAIQSMLSCHPACRNDALRQIKELEEHGCEIIRVAMPDMEAVETIPFLLQNMKTPLVADVHFRSDIAMECIKKGVHKLRLNPSNIKDRDAITAITKAAKERGIPIRVGANKGSLKHAQTEEEALSQMKQLLQNEIDLLEKEDFTSIVLSAKCSEPVLNQKINEWMHKQYSYPIHIGITEAGPLITGIVTSSIGLTPLLQQGIGSTIRISLTGEIKAEVLTAKALLCTLGKRSGITIVSCPTCGRCKWNVKKYVDLFEKETASVEKNLKVALMGCEVNGPGEAADADVGMAGAGKKAVLFQKGKIQATGTTEEIFQQLLRIVKETTKSV